ncbi:MAG TPA: hypothetical protein VGI39_36820 [Polyangiaceae bacterium]|jgi:hypothetical protein
MNATETIFFSVAFLLPLAGGGLLLYFLAKGAKKPDSKSDEDSRPRG